MSRTNGRTSWVACVVLAAAAAAVLALARPPAPQPADAPETLFSAERAMRHVERIAMEPHPVGSPAHARVRTYLLDQLAGLGLEPQLQVTAGLFPVGPNLHNIVARRPGTDNTRALMLVAHYDSVPTGPGAGDDGAAVAALLETVRALPPLRNDLIVLITDGEEMGLRGAIGFVNAHPWAQDVGLFLNFEARGNAGSSLMFRATEPNAGLIRGFAAASTRPAATSIMGDFSRRMPNDTDFTVFNVAGIPGLDFALIGGPMAYHSSHDTPANLSRASLQHHGEQMLSLATHFGSLDLRESDEGDVIYFDIAHRFLVVYGTTFVWPLTAAAILVYAWFLRRARPGMRDALRGFGAALATVVLAGLFAYGLDRLILMRDGIEINPRMKATHSDLWFWFAEAAFAVGVAAWFTKRVGPQRLGLGMGALWVLALIGTSAGLRGGSYLFLWPLLCGLAALRLRERPVAASVCMIPAIFIVVPLTWLLYLAIPRLPGAVALLAMLLGLCAPAFKDTRYLPICAALGGVALAGIGMLTL